MRLASLLCLLALACSSVALPTQARLDDAVPPVVVVLQGPGNHESIWPWEGDGGVTLRLTNNTVWPLGVDSYPDEQLPTEGEVRFCDRMIPAARNGVRIRPALDMHEVLRPPPQTGEFVEVSGYILTTTVWIAPGRSVLFTLPEKALHAVGSVEVPVLFPWERTCSDAWRMPLRTTVSISTFDIAWKAGRFGSTDGGS